MHQRGPRPLHVNKLLQRIKDGEFEIARINRSTRSHNELQEEADMKFRKALERTFDTDESSKRDKLFDMAWKIVIEYHAMRDCAYLEIVDVYSELVDLVRE